MKFEEYLASVPDLHTWDGGKTWNSGGFHRFHLEAFHALATALPGEGSTILETGAGNSTLTFAFAHPRKLISIAPDEDLFSRIRDFAQSADLDLSPMEAIVDRSEVVLPRLADSGLAIDMALIDGGHGWPTVFVDFCYVNCMLRKNGLLIIDDVQLHTTKELARLLTQQPEFKFKQDLGKSLVFEKVTEWKYLPDWNQQPYIVAQTERYSASASPLSLDC